MDRFPADDSAAMVLEASPDGMLVVDCDGRIRHANGAATQIFGHDRDALVAMSVDELVPDEQRARHAHLRATYLAAPTRRPMGTGLRLLAQHRDGSLFPVEISLSPVSTHGGSATDASRSPTDATDRRDVMTIAAVRDVSDRQDVMERVALLDERSRIARDIHDMVIQRIFAAGMSIQSIVGLVDSPLVSERLTLVIDELDETIRSLRQAIFELGNDEGATPTSHVASVVGERSRHLGFEPELRIIGDLDELPDDVADQLVATLTEGLSNVARHAGATVARIEIHAGDADVRLQIDDDGVGIGVAPRPGGGLSNMMWRAAELGGSCSVVPNEPRGTRLAWTVPLGTTSAAGSTHR